MAAIRRPPRVTISRSCPSASPNSASSASISASSAARSNSSSIAAAERPSRSTWSLEREQPPLVDADHLEGAVAAVEPVVLERHHRLGGRGDRPVDARQLSEVARHRRGEAIWPGSSPSPPSDRAYLGIRGGLRWRTSSTARSRSSRSSSPSPAPAFGERPGDHRCHDPRGEELGWWELVVEDAQQALDQARVARPCAPPSPASGEGCVRRPCPGRTSTSPRRRESRQDHQSRRTRSGVRGAVEGALDRAAPARPPGAGRRRSPGRGSGP